MEGSSTEGVGSVEVDAREREEKSDGECLVEDCRRDERRKGRRDDMTGMTGDGEMVEGRKREKSENRASVASLPRTNHQRSKGSLKQEN